MALRKYVPSVDAASVNMKSLTFSSKGNEKAQLADKERSGMEADVDIDLREVYFLIMHFLSAGPCERTYGQFWNELLEHQLLPRRYHAWYSRSGAHSGDENDDGLSFPLGYNKLVERYLYMPPLYCSTTIFFFCDFYKDHIINRVIFPIPLVYPVHIVLVGFHTIRYSCKGQIICTYLLN